MLLHPQGLSQIDQLPLTIVKAQYHGKKENDYFIYFFIYFYNQEREKKIKTGHLEEKNLLVRRTTGLDISQSPRGRWGAPSFCRFLG